MEEYVYLKFPRNATEVATTINQICDDYYNRTINEVTAKDALLYLVNNYNNDIYNNGKYRSTILRYSGRKRLSFLERILKLDT